MRAPDPLSRLPLAATEIAASIAQHRVLSTPQVREIHFAARSLRWAQLALARLREAELVDFVANPGAPGAPRRLWFATERGARAALRAGALEAMPRLLDAEAAAGPLLSHNVAVNEAAIAFLRAARDRGDDFGPLAWRHEVAFRLGRARREGPLFADAVLTYLREAGSDVVVEQRFLELDRATLSVDRLCAELRRYRRLLRAEATDGRLFWQAQFRSFPPIICVLAGASRSVLERRLDTAVAILGADPEAQELSIRFCLAEDLAARGPFAPIFVDVGDPEEPVDWLLAEAEEPPA